MGEDSPYGKAPDMPVPSAAFSLSPGGSSSPYKGPGGAPPIPTSIQSPSPAPAPAPRSPSGQQPKSPSSKVAATPSRPPADVLKQIKFAPSDEMKITGTFEDETKQEITITNPTDEVIAFKCKGTSPDLIKQKPGYGYIEPNSKAVITVIISSMKNRKKVPGKQRVSTMLLVAPSKRPSKPVKLWKDKSLAKDALRKTIKLKFKRKKSKSKSKSKSKKSKSKKDKKEKEGSSSEEGSEKEGSEKEGSEKEGSEKESEEGSEKDED